MPQCFAILFWSRTRFPNSSKVDIMTQVFIPVLSANKPKLDVVFPLQQENDILFFDVSLSCSFQFMSIISLSKYMNSSQVDRIAVCLHNHWSERSSFQQQRGNHLLSMVSQEVIMMLFFMKQWFPRTTCHLLCNSPSLSYELPWMKSGVSDMHLLLHLQFSLAFMMCCKRCWSTGLRS